MIAPREALDEHPGLHLVTCNPCTVVDGMVTMELADGYTTILDMADLPHVAGLRWWPRHARGYVYAEAKQDGQVILFHRLIMGLTVNGGRKVKHLNGNRLDNRRQNLSVSGVWVHHVRTKGREYAYYVAQGVTVGGRVKRYFPYNSEGYAWAHRWLVDQWARRGT